MTGGQSLTRWLVIAIAFGVVALLAAFLPSPFGLFGLFDAASRVELRQPPALSLREMPAASAFAEIRGRPLFNAGRKPDPSSGSVAGVPAAAGAAPGELSEYRVVGIVADQTTQRAIVERSGAPSLKLAPGDRLGAWRIDKIDAAGIVASKDAQTVRIGIGKARPRTGMP